MRWFLPETPAEESQPRRLTVPVSRALTVAASSPPLLLVKVYQDLMVLLFKTNADLKGLKSREGETIRQIDSLNTELINLASKQATYTRLNRAVDQATLSADTYAKRAIDEAVTENMAAAKLSSLKILQVAYPPLTSNFSGRFAMSIIALCSILFSVVITLGIEFLAPKSSTRRREVSSVALREQDVKKFDPQGVTIREGA